MRIQHNVAALNSYRQMSTNNSALSKNLEKLSSGYKINRAGDDAAGLAISEKMRAQIKGLEAAKKNANDAISLVQTAEGALTEVHDMLNRMTYLATQSANGTYENEVDRAALQAEVDQLLGEIDRISDATNFNGIDLLNGTMGGPVITKTDGTSTTAGTDGTDGVGDGDDDDGGAEPGFVTATGTVNGAELTGTDVAETSATAANFKVALNGLTITSASTTTTVDIAGTQIDVTPATADDAGVAKAIVDEVNADGKITIDNNDYTVALDSTDTTGKTLIFTAVTEGTSVTPPDTTKKIEVKSNGSGDSTISASNAGTDLVAAHETYDFSTFQTGDKITVDGKEYVYDTSAGDTDALKFSSLSDLKTKLAANNITLDDTVNTACTLTKTAASGASAAAATPALAAAAAAPTVNGTPGTVTGVDGDGTTKASLSFDLSGMSIDAPTDGSTGATVEFEIGGQKLTIDVTGNMTDGDIADALNNQTITIDNQTLTATATGTQIKFEAGDATATTNCAGITSFTLTGQPGTPAADPGDDDDTTIDGDDDDTTIDGDGDGDDDGDATKTPAKTEINFADKKGSDIMGGKLTINGTTYEFVEKAGDLSNNKNTAVIIGKDEEGAALADKLMAQVAKDTKLSADYTVSSANGVVTIEETTPTGTTKAVDIGSDGFGKSMQIGDSSDSYNQMRVEIGNMGVDALGIKDLKIDTQSDAADAIAKIKNAINTVSSQRGKLGAVQNRLEHTINNLGTTTENITEAESRIRDTDMAEEMMAYTKNNILLQAAQSMLAQANQVPQGVLQLLQ